MNGARLKFDPWFLRQVECACSRVVDSGLAVSGRSSGQGVEKQC